MAKVQMGWLLAGLIAMSVAGVGEAKKKSSSHHAASSKSSSKSHGKSSSKSSHKSSKSSRKSSRSTRAPSHRAATVSRSKALMGQVELPALSYTVDRSGPAGGEHPKRRDSVIVNYTLTLPDGKVIDKSDAPVTFPLARLIPAWQILVPMMRPGDAWTFYVPSEYGYGPQAMGEMPANAFLIFKVELVGIAPPTPATNTPPAGK